MGEQRNLAENAGRARMREAAALMVEILLDANASGCWNLAAMIEW